MSIAEQTLRSAVEAVVLVPGEHGGEHGTVPTRPPRVGFRFLWCAAHPRCPEEFTATWDQVAQFLYLARWLGLVRSIPDWTRYATGAQRPGQGRMPLEVLAGHVREHGPIPTAVVTALPAGENSLPLWAAASGEIRAGRAPEPAVHAVLAQIADPRATYQEALLDRQSHALRTGAVPVKPCTGPMSQRDAAEVLSAIGHPLAQEAAERAARFHRDTRVDYATDACKAVFLATEQALRLKGPPAKRLDNEFHHRRARCADALKLAIALRCSTCSEALTLWSLFTEQLDKTASVTRALRKVCNVATAVALVLESTI